MANSELKKATGTGMILAGELCLNCLEMINCLFKLQQQDLAQDQQQQLHQLIINQTENDKEDKCPLCSFFLCLAVFSNHKSCHGVRAWFWQDKSQGPMLYGVLILRQTNGSTTNETFPIEIRQVDCTGIHDNLSIGHTDPSPIIQNWLKSCLLEHNHSITPVNDSYEYGFKTPESFYLIDCIQECIVKVKAKLDIGFVALSYMWGSVKQPTLRKSNLEALQTKGFLNENLIKLPHTIRDAMNFCVALNIPYLWVDALCIVQDDEETKMLHINNMENIYRKATFTIVGASGKDSNGGLPAFHYQTFKPPEFVCVRNLHFSEWKTNWSDYSPPKPRWTTRAWTFQEEMLSTRKVIFSQDRIFCICPNDTLVYEYTSNRLVRNMDSKEPHFVRFTPGPMLVDSNEHPYIKFQRYLEHYLQRDILYNSDNLNAFTGIIRSFEPDIGSCWFGIPIRAFVYFSLFTVTQPSGQVSGFPSWSWACWKKGTSSVWPNIYKVISSVNFYRFNEKGILILLPLHDLGWEVTDGIRPVLCSKPSENELSHVMPIQANGIPQSHLLVCWAWELEFYLRTSSIRPGEFLIMRNRDDSDDNFIGCVDLEIGTVPKMDQYCFILYAINSKGNLKPILIERNDGISRRLSICHVWKLSLEAWMNLKPKRSLIVMA
jgi:Heterokaryon incompatibility protein (HET)